MSEATELPEFEGTAPIGVVTKVTGTGQRITRAMHYEERVLLLVEAEVGNVAHVKTGDGMKRVHGLAVRDLYELDADEGQALLRKHRSKYRQIEDEKAGRNPLAFDDTAQPAQYIADGGVVLTGREIAEQRGEIYDPDGDLLTVEFADGTRGLWPEDWAGSGQTLASVGGRMRLPAGEPGETGQVVRLLDVESGAVVAEWSDEDEAERLDAAEAAALAEEAAEDRAALEVLEGGRSDRFGDEPWEGYDTAGARDLVPVIREETDLAQLQHAQRYEEAHGQRASVMKALDKRVAELTAAED